MTMRRYKHILILAAVVGAMALLGRLPVAGYVERMLEAVKGLGPLGPVLLVLAYVGASVFLIPGSAMTLLIGGAYGLWKGLLIVVIGANLAALCSFLLSRTFLRERALRWAAGQPRFAALDRAIDALRDGQIVGSVTSGTPSLSDCLAAGSATRRQRPT